MRERARRERWGPKKVGEKTEKKKTRLALYFSLFFVSTFSRRKSTSFGAMVLKCVSFLGTISRVLELTRVRERGDESAGDERRRLSKQERVCIDDRRRRLLSLGTHRRSPSPVSRVTSPGCFRVSRASRAPSSASIAPRALLDEARRSPRLPDAPLEEMSGTMTSDQPPIEVVGVSKSLAFALSRPPCWRAHFALDAKRHVFHIDDEMHLISSEHSRDLDAAIFFFLSLAARVAAAAAALDCFLLTSVFLFLSPPSKPRNRNQPQDASLQVLGLEDLPGARHPLHQDGQPGETSANVFYMFFDRHVDASPQYETGVSLSRPTLLAVAVSHSDPRWRSRRLPSCLDSF